MIVDSLRPFLRPPRAIPSPRFSPGRSSCFTSHCRCSNADSSPAYDGNPWIHHGMPTNISCNSPTAMTILALMLLVHSDNKRNGPCKQSWLLRHLPSPSTCLQQAAPLLIRCFIGIMSLASLTLLCNRGQSSQIGGGILYFATKCQTARFKPRLPAFSAELARLFLSRLFHGIT